MTIQPSNKDKQNGVEKLYRDYNSAIARGDLSVANDINKKIRQSTKPAKIGPKAPIEPDVADEYTDEIEHFNEDTNQPSGQENNSLSHGQRDIQRANEFANADPKAQQTAEQYEQNRNNGLTAADIEKWGTRRSGELVNYAPGSAAEANEVRNILSVKNAEKGQSPQEQAAQIPAPSPKSPKEEAGGLARLRDSFRRKPNTGKTEDESNKQAGTAENAAKKQLADRATTAIKEWAAKRWAAVLAVNPITWVIIGVGIVIAIILFIVALSYMGTINSPGPSTSGGKPLIAVKPTNPADASSLQNFLKLTGDKTVTEQAINDTTSSMKKNLLETKDLEAVKANPVLVKQIDTALGSLSILEGTKSQESAKVFLNDLGKVYDSMEANVPVWNVDSSNPTRLPVSGTVTLFNSDLHGNSFLRNDAVDNNNVYIRSDNGQEKCDAVDIGTTQGETIYPIFGGKIIDVSSDGDTSNGEKVIVNSNDGKYTALYAHIQFSSKKKGDAITTAEPLGIAKTNNIQIEIFYTDPATKENNCLVTTHADMIDHALSSRRHQDWGGYLWDRVVKTFSLK